MPDELVKYIVEEMMEDLPLQRILDGSSLLFNFDGAAVQSVLNNFLTPDNAGVDRMSSTFGRGTYTADSLVLSSRSAPPEMENATLAGQLETEPIFGAIYWSETISAEFIERWCKFYKPQLPPMTFSLSFPPINPHIPTKFELKPLPSDEGESYHIILHCSLKVCIAIGTKTVRQLYSWEYRQEKT